MPKWTARLPAISLGLATVVVAGDAWADPPTTPAEPARTTAPVRARRRRVRRRRARGALVSIGWRLTGIATEGTGGLTHAGYLSFQPLARQRGGWRYVRFTAGIEAAFRSAWHGQVDPIVWATTGLGAQWPGKRFTPYAMALLHLGGAVRSRFGLPMPEFAWTIGIEAGTDLRIANFFGLGLTVGAGRTVIGEQYSYGAWLRAGIALY